MGAWAVGTAEAPAAAQGQWDEEDAVLAVFQRFDRNGDCTIDRRELSRVLKTLDAKTWNDQSIKRLFNQVDVNRDGTLDVGEFLEFVFNNESGKAVIDTVFDSLPLALRTRLFEATERRTKIVINISPQDLTLMLRWRSPPRVAVLVMSAMCWLLFFLSSSDPGEAWEMAKDLLLSQPMVFLQGLLEPPWTITEEAMEMVEELTADPDFTCEVAGGAAGMPAGPDLVEWVRAVIDFHRAFREIVGAPGLTPHPSCPPSLASSWSTARDRVLTAFSESSLPPTPAMSRARASSGVAGATASGLLVMSMSSMKSTLPKASADEPLVVSPAAVLKPWAKAVSGIRRVDLMELKSFKSPPRQAQVVLSAVCWLLTGQGHTDPHYSWRLSRTMLGNTSKFMRQLLDPPRASPVALQSVRETMQRSAEAFKPHVAARVNPCIAALAEWVTVVASVQGKLREFECDAG